MFDHPSLSASSITAHSPIIELQLHPPERRIPTHANRNPASAPKPPPYSPIILPTTPQHQYTTPYSPKYTPHSTNREAHQIREGLWQPTLIIPSIYLCKAPRFCSYLGRRNQRDDSYIVGLGDRLGNNKRYYGQVVIFSMIYTWDAIAVAKSFTLVTYD